MLERLRSATRPEADGDLIAQARHDPAAFGQIYDLYLNRVYAFCLSRSRSREEAEDLTAQTFERALTAIKRYDDRGAPLSSWLLRIAANAATDRWRRHGHEGPSVSDSSSLSGHDGHSEGPDRETTGVVWVEEWERASWMREQVAALSDDQRRAVHLRFFDDRSIADIALCLGRSEGAVKQLLQRALRTLRDQLQREEGTHV